MKSPSYTTRLAGLSLLVGALASPTAQAQQTRSGAKHSHPLETVGAPITNHLWEVPTAPSVARQHDLARKRADETAGRTSAQEARTKAVARLAPRNMINPIISASAINRVYYRAFGLNPARPAATLPFAENFDGVAAGDLPVGWTIVDANNDGSTWENLAVPFAQSAPNALRYNYSASSPADDWIFTPVLQIPGGQPVEVGVGYRITDPLYPENFDIAYGTAPTVAAMGAPIASITASDTTYQQALGNIPSVAGARNLYVGFHCTSIADQFRLYLDDVTVQAPAACPAPTALAATSVTGTTATLTFAPGTGTNFSVIYGPTGFNPATAGTTVATTTGSVAVTGLTGSTPYQFYVSSNCGAAGISTLAGPVSFTTQCIPGAVTLPYAENFDAGGAGAQLPCGWSVLNINADTVTWRIVARPQANSAPNALSIRWNPAAAMDDWAFLPGIQLTAGQSYDIGFKYAGFSTTFQEKLEVRVGTAPTVAAATASVFNDDAILTAAPTYLNGAGSFVAPTTGLYYFGFHGYSDADQFRIFVDDVTVQATPACPAPTLLGATAITSTGATLTFTPGTGTNFSVVYGPTGFNPATGGTTVTTTTGSVAVTGLTPLTNYQFYVTRDCGVAGNSTQVGPFAFSTLCVPPTVTLPYNEGFESSVSPAVPCGIQVLDANNDGSKWRVYQADSLNRPAALRPHSGQNLIGYFYNTNGTTAADDWFFLPAMTIPTGGADLKFWWASAFAAGQIWTESLEVKYGTAANPAAMTNPLFSGSITDTVYQEVTATTLPASATPIYIGFHCNSAADKFFLNLDDINIDVPPACPAPTALGATAITSTGATLTFTPGTGTNFSVRYGATGFNPTTGGTVVTTTTGSVAITGLTPSTAYQFYVTRDCGAAGNSTQVGPFAFSTLCAPVPITLPYTENFDAAVGFPCGWATANVNADTAVWHVGNLTGLTFSDPNGLRIDTGYDPANGKDDWAFTPGLVMTSGQSVDLDFQYRGFAASGEKLEVKAGLTQTPAAMTSAPIFDNAAITNQTFNAGAGTFVAPTAGTYYFGFHAYSDTTSYRIYLDNISLRTTPTCPAPTALGASAITGTGATLTFTPGTGTNFSVRYGVTGFNPTTGGTVVATTTGSVAVTGLLPSTAYQFYVTSNCGAAGTSTQAGPFAFTTQCAATVISTFPFTQNFDTTPAGTLPCGWTVENLNGDTIQWRNRATTSATSAPHAASIRTNFTADMDDWLYLPGIQMSAGNIYSLNFNYNGLVATSSEKLEVKVGTAPAATAMVTQIFNDDNIVAITGQPGTGTYQPTTSGVYYIGFHGYSAQGQQRLYVDDLVLTQAPTGISNPTLERAVRVYPNPTAGRVTVNVQATHSQHVALTVLDQLGRAVYAAPAADNATQVLDLSHLANGLYTLRIALDDQVVIKRLVVQQ